MNKYLQQIQSICNNKYIQTYGRICTYASTRAKTKRTANSIVGYTEKHHILPKAFQLGGQKDTENYVYLTAREHFVCHKLLVCGMKNTSYYYFCLNAMKKFLQMTSKQKRVLTGRNYQFVRKCLSDSMKGENNPMFGKKGILHPRYGQKHTHETKKLIRDKRKTQPISEAMLVALKNGRNDSTGTKHTEGDLVKMREAQSGRAWVHTSTERRRVKKEDVQMYLDRGFLLGKGSIN